MVNVLDRLVLYFIFTLGLIAVILWTISLIQMSKIIDQSNLNLEEHHNGSLEARKNVLEAKQNATLNLELTKVNKKNIENILGNITEINQKLNNFTK